MTDRPTRYSVYCLYLYLLLFCVVLYTCHFGLNYYLLTNRISNCPVCNTTMVTKRTFYHRSLHYWFRFCFSLYDWCCLHVVSLFAKLLSNQAGLPYIWHINQFFSFHYLSLWHNFVYYVCSHMATTNENSLLTCPLFVHPKSHDVRAIGCVDFSCQELLLIR